AERSEPWRHRVRHDADVVCRVSVVLRDFTPREFADGDQCPDALEQQWRHGPVETPEQPRIAFRVTYVGDVVMSCDLVAVGQRTGVAQRNQWRVAVACQPQWQVQLLP